MELQGEPRAHFAQVCPRAISVKLVAMMPEEDEVSLIMPGDHTSFFQLRVLGEQTGDEATDTVTQHGVKVVHYELGRDHHAVVCAVVLDVLVQFHARNTEDGSRSFRQMAED